jgi:hypothetical protein
MHPAASVRHGTVVAWVGLASHGGRITYDREDGMPPRNVVPVPLIWVNAGTGQTASMPGAGYWVGMGEGGGRFNVTVAYGETVVGYYAVGSEDEAFVILRRLLLPAPCPEQAARRAHAGRGPGRPLSRSPLDVPRPPMLTHADACP